MDTPKAEWLGPANILVITFTNKATAEMSSRIYKDINTLIRKGKLEIDGLGQNILHSSAHGYSDWILETFSRNQIKTIDAFCAKILREHPIQAKIDPTISTGDENDIRDLTQNTLHEFFQQLYSNNNENFLNLVDHLGLYRIRSAIQYLLENHNEVSTWEDQYSSKTPEEIFQLWQDKYEPDAPVGQAAEILFETFKQILAIRMPDDTKEKLQLMQNMIENFVQSNGSKSFYRQNIHPILVTASGTYKKKVDFLPNQTIWKNHGFEINDQKAIKQNFLECIAEIKSILPDEIINSLFTSDDQLAAKLLVDIVELYHEFAQLLWQKKLENHMISYSDVLFQSNMLLSDHPEIGEQYGRVFPHIMVDEFQDTNDLRWSIIKTICSSNGLIRSKGIFLVGDEKQSIYKFQNADVKVLNQAIKDLQNKDIPPLEIEFDDNYRSSAEFINRAINPLFSKLFSPESEKRKSYEAKFNPTSYPLNKSMNVKEKDRSIGGFMDVNILTVGADEPESDESTYKQDDLAYARHLATLIKDLQETPHYKQLDCPPGKPKIGVLLQNVKSNIGPYREAFKQSGLKAEIIGSRGFYSRQEIMDVEMIISVLINPLDDVALAGLLRSPIFALNDDELTQMLEPARGRFPVFELLENDFPDIFKEINNWLYKVHIDPLDRLLTGIFNTEFRELGYLSESDGPQRWKNIHKCIRLIHKWSLDGKHLIRIQSLLRQRRSTHPDEEFAQLSVNSDIVIMSIHKAKGLDFPFVVLPDLHRLMNFDNKSSFSMASIPDKSGNEHIEMGFTFSSHMGKKSNSVILRLLRKNAFQELFAEYIRLFYVAVTRAQYGVILSGVIEEHPKKGYPELIEFRKSTSSWMNWVRDIYQITADRLTEGSMQQDEADITLTPYQQAKRVNNSHNIASVDYSYTIPKKPNNSSFHVSVHYLTESLNPTPEMLPSENSSQYSSAAFGTFIHWVLEHNYLDIDKYNQQLQNQLDRPQYFELLNHHDEIFQHINELANYPQITKVFDYPENDRFTEYPVRAEFNSTSTQHSLIISGVIDLLFKESDEWVVRDYKTDINRKYHKQYVHQVQIYLHLLKYMFHFPKIRAEIAYTRLQDIIVVPYEQDFFTNLKYESISGWEPSYLADENIFLSEQMEALPQNAIIICPSRLRVNQLMTRLSSQKQLHPTMIIDTFAGLNTKYNSQPAPGLLIRSLIRKYQNNFYLDYSFKDYPGILQALKKNYDLFDNHGILPDNELQNLNEDIKEQLSNSGYFPYLSADNFRLNLFHGKHVYLDALTPVSKKEIEFIPIIRDNCEKLIQIELDAQVDQNHLPPWHQYFDLNEELTDIRSRIEIQISENINLDDIIIILPSMEKYVPILLPIFEDASIPVQLSKGEPLFERPVIHACLTLLRLMDSSQLTWQDMKPYFMHPISFCIYPDDHNEYISLLRKLDIKLRKNGNAGKVLNKLDLYQSILDVAESKHHTNIEIEPLCKFIAGYVSEINNSSGPIYKRFEYVITHLFNQYSKSIDNMEKKAVDSFSMIVQQLSIFLNKNYPAISVVEYGLELRESLKMDISTETHNDGISLLSVADSINNTHGKYLYIPGLVQGDFPSQTPTGFMMENLPDFHYNANQMIFNSWISGAKEVFLSCPTNGVDGSEQQYSIFLESMEVIKSAPLVSPELFYRNKLLLDKGNVPQNLKKQIHRHNTLLNRNPENEYSGKVPSLTEYHKGNRFSASQLSMLTKTPLLYLMRYIWKLQEVDPEYNIAAFMGNVIHKILELFGNNDPSGWEINKSNPQKAESLLFQTSIKVIQDYPEIGYEEKLYLQSFTNGLVDDKQDPGVFKNLLIEDRQVILDFTFRNAEQAFGYQNTSTGSWPDFTISHDELGTLKFGGTIDRIDALTNGGIILAVDFKTGIVSEFKTIPEMSPQLKLYYLVLKTQFPNQTVIITYRRINRDQNKSGFSKSWLGDLGPSDIDDIRLNKPNSKTIITGDDLENIVIDDILEAFSPFVLKYFPIYLPGISPKEIRYNFLEAASRIETMKYWQMKSDNRE